MSLSKGVAITCATIKKKEGSHLRCKTANKGLNVRELVEMIETK